ncbi:MAG: hypothetical protein POG74_03655 [Acidocella sp.]|nr:hypothetical protein [Acidocella sp.]
MSFTFVNSVHIAVIIGWLSLSGGCPAICMCITMVVIQNPALRGSDLVSACADAAKLYPSIALAMVCLKDSPAC